MSAPYEKRIWVGHMGWSYGAGEAPGKGYFRHLKRCPQFPVGPRLIDIVHKIES